MQMSVVESFYRLNAPQMFFHVDAAVFTEADALFFEETPPIFPTGCSSSLSVDDPMTGIAPEKIRHAQDIPDQTGIFLSPDKRGDLNVCRYIPDRDVLHNREDFI